MKASDRAYKAFNQHEKSRRVGHHNEIIEKRKVFRKGYDTTGPNDERYYVSASSGIGTDGSKTETDSSGREEEGNLFVKLLQNQVLNYNHSPKSSSPRERKRDKARVQVNLEPGGPRRGDPDQEDVRVQSGAEN